MNANTWSDRLVRKACRLLNQDAYYDKIDLFPHTNVAAYEVGHSFQERQARDYTTIIAASRKIPEKILQKHTKLFMWYDQALTRTGEE